jgi:hypothetical protein
MRSIKIVALCSVLAILISTKTATAQSNLWVEAVVYSNSSGGGLAEFHVSASKKLTSEIGVFGWAVTNKSWAESLAGILYEPNKSVSLQLGAGIEENKNPLRSTASVWTGGGKGSLFGVVEYGGSGFWYKSVGKANFLFNQLPVGIGYYAQRFEGIGPYLEAHVSSLTLYGSPIMFDPEHGSARNALVAVRFTP